MRTNNRASSWTKVLSRGVAVLGTGALVLSGLFTVTPVAVATDTEESVNWALSQSGATVEASGQEVNGQWGPEKLIDGQINPGSTGANQSRWSSNTDDNAWAKITFKQPVPLHHINLWWEHACPKKWDLLISTDGEEFTKMQGSDAQECPEKNGSAKTVVNIPEELSSQRFVAVKLQVRERTPLNGVKWGASLWEIEAFDGPEPVAPVPSVPTEAGSSLVPKPVELTTNDGPGFGITANTSIVAPDALKNEAELLAASLRSSTGYPVPVVSDGEATGNIVLATGAVQGSESEEAYSLSSTPQTVTITGVGNHGVFNGSMTLLQLLPGFVHMKTPVVADWTVPAVTIKDWPRYSYRGMMLDIARSFIPPQDIKKLIDTLSQYKISRLHLHLADDQGWRIEITNKGRVAGDDIDYTKLTELSGKTAVNAHEKQFSQELGRTGFLTQDEYRDIQSYAKARHVTIVPEIDVPGHVNAALHAIPQLNTDGSSHPATDDEPTAPQNTTGAVGYSYLDPEAAVSRTFVRHVMNQIAEMTDGPYLHIGGDEPHKLVHTYGQAVYNKFLGDVLKMVRDAGKTPLGWNEIAHADGLAQGDIMHYWTGNSTATKNAIKNHGAKVLLSKGNTSYLDQKYTDKTPIALNWACRGSCDFDHYYDWDPRQFIGLDDDSAIAGTEAPLWSETVRGIDQVEFLTFMRTLSHAEIGWTPQAKRDRADFVERISQIGVDLNATGSNFYDGTAGNWGYDVAGVRSTMGSTSGTVQLGYLSAPGTVVDAEDPTVIKTDRVNDEDGISRSLIGNEGQKVMVDWGDGSDPEPATITATLPRSAYNAPGLYALTAKHSFASEGEHTVTLTIGNRTAQALVTVKSNGDSTPVLHEPWTPTGTPAVTLGESQTTPGSRVELNAEHFAPNTLADVSLGDTKIGQIRPDKDGTRNMYIQVPPGTPAGVYQMTVTQGDRTASAQIAIWSKGTAQLENPVSGITVAGFNSEEKTGETAPNGLANAAVDGKANTYWHTKWQNGADTFPHFISLNLNETCRVQGIEYTPRQNNSNTRFKRYQVFVSADGTNWGDAVAEGAFDSSPRPKYVPFNQVEANYVKLVGLDSQNGDNFGGAAEIRVDGLCGDQQPLKVSVTGNQDPVEAANDAGNNVVTATEGEEVTVNIANLGSAGQVSLWAGEKPTAFTSAMAEVGKETQLTFTAGKSHDGQQFVVVTPGGRRYFTVKLEKPAPVDPDPTSETPVEPADPTPEPADPTPVPATRLVMAKADVPSQPVARDVYVDTQFSGEIRWMYNEGHSTGWPDGTYRPLTPISREAMAAFLYRLAGSPDVTYASPAFRDITVKSAFHREIQWMHEAGISTGWDDGTYRPLEPVSREAMAAFLYRFCSTMSDKCAAPINPAVLDTSDVPLFVDVSTNSIFAKQIRWLAAAKVSTGWDDGTFRPYQPIARDAMAAFLYRMKHNYLAPVQ